MSVVGYLSAGKPVVRVVRKDAGELGIRFEKAADEQFRADAVRRIEPADEHYASVDDYDPVLRAHCRL
jgi:hypothetical protein